MLFDSIIPKKDEIDAETSIKSKEFKRFQPLLSKALQTLPLIFGIDKIAENKYPDKDSLSFQGCKDILSEYTKNYSAMYARESKKSIRLRGLDAFGLLTLAPSL
jgi:hypothetical protein